MSKLRINTRFGIIPNSLLNNSELTFKAKGLYWYLQSKPDNWDFSVERIKFDTKESRDAISSWLKELENSWYLERNKYQTEKWFWDIEYVLYENPKKENPILENPIKENPETIIKKEINKKEIIKKEIIIPKKQVFKDSSFEYKISKYFLDFHIKNQTPSIIYLLKNNSEENILNKWSEEIAKLKRIDNFKEKEIDFIIKYTLQDDFWKNQILSIEKFRKKKDWVLYFIKMIDQAKFNQKDLLPKEKKWVI